MSEIRTKKTPKRLCFLGAGGVSMSSLARLSRRAGQWVYGVDREAGPWSALAERDGIPIQYGQNVIFQPKTDLAVYTLALPPEHPWRVSAEQNGIPTVSRPAFLSQCMRPYRYRIGVAGSHGKSTVSALTHAVFTAAGLSPTVLCGAPLKGGDPLQIGGGDVCIAEACEYKDAFLQLSLTDALLLNAEWDHTDYFLTPSALCDSMRQFAERAERAYLFTDDPALQYIAKTLSHRPITFGTHDADLIYESFPLRAGYYGLHIAWQGREYGDVSLSLPGEFACAQAAGVLALAFLYGIPWDRAKRAIEAFHGIGRRLERIGTIKGTPVYYDYAHHPTEIRAGLRTLCQMHGSVAALFRPHTYSRTADLWREFVEALGHADKAYITDIFPAREAPLPGITSERLARAIGEGAEYIPLEQTDRVFQAEQGCLALMGAGDLTKALVYFEKNKDKEG